MKKIVVVLCLMFGFIFIFAGCSQNSIKFERDSKFGEFMNNFQKPEKPQVKKSSGLVIYSDESKSSNQKQNNSDSGIGDINFDLPMKF